MKNIFIQHIPSCVSGVDKKTFEFDTLQELLDNSIVKRWCMHPLNENEVAPEGYFRRYSLSENRLMAEFKNGKEWWVIGFIKYPEKLDLPKWEPVR